MAFDYKIDARDAMDQFYPGGWTYRTAPHVGSDCGAAFNAALVAAKAANGGRAELVIPSTGAWLQTTPFDHNAIAGCYVHGDTGPFGTSIHYDSDADAFLPLYYTGGSNEGGRFKDLQITLEAGHPAGPVGIQLWALDNTGAPCGYIFEGLRMSVEAGSSWSYCFIANGVNKNTGAQGIRELTIRDSDFFCARTGGIWAQGVVGFRLDRVGVWVPVAHGGDSLTIGGTSLTNSNSVYSTGVVCGSVNLSNVNGVVGNFRSGGLTVGSTVTNAGIIHIGPVSGSVGSGYVSPI